MNPYDAFLNGQDPMVILRETVLVLPAKLAAHEEAGTTDTPPAPGKWTFREIIAHLADTETVFAVRLRQAVAEEHHTIQPFDQERWARGYAATDLEEALALFNAMRAWNLHFIAAQPGSTMEKTLTHPERGTMTFRALVETMAGHDRNHLEQIEATLSGRRRE